MVAIVVATRVFKQRNTSPEYERFKWITVVMCAANVAILSLVQSDERFGYPLQPLLIIVLIQELFVILESNVGIRGRRIAVAAIVIFSAFYYLKIITLKYKPRSDAAFTRFGEIAKPKSLVISDSAYATAFLNDVVSVRLPHYPEDTLEISEKYLPIDYV